MHPAAKPSTCEGCPAYSLGVGWVPPEVPTRQVDLIVIGQGPGETEARFSRPFHPEAPAGAMMTRWLNKAGFQRTRALLTNVVWCWLPSHREKGLPRGNREPKASEVAFCRERHLDPLLSVYPETLRVSVGTPATRSLLHLGAVSKYTGTFVWRDE